MLECKFVKKKFQLHFRSILIEHLKNSANTLKVTYGSLHLAVYLLDIFMDHYEISINKMSAICDACLSLSCK